MTNRQKLLTALVEKPSRYTIDVVDNSMLPANIQDSKKLDFVVKPPTLETLAKCAIPLQEIPQELMKDNIVIKDVLPYIDQLVKVICVVSHGKETDYPDWYEPFFKKNTTPKEVFQIFQEVSLKMQTDFFLTSFQIASQANPMMMKNPKSRKGLIHTS